MESIYKNSPKIVLNRNSVEATSTGDSHNHSNLDLLNLIDQNLSSTGFPTFDGINIDDAASLSLNTEFGDPIVMLSAPDYPTVIETQFFASFIRGEDSPGVLKSGMILTANIDDPDFLFAGLVYSPNDTILSFMILNTDTGAIPDGLFNFVGKAYYAGDPDIINDGDIIHKKYLDERLDPIDNVIQPSSDGVVYTSSGILYNYDTLPKYAGPITTITFTDNGDGSADIGSFDALVYSSTNYTGILKKYTIPATTISFTDNTEEYVVVDYNGGNPIARKETNKFLINGSSILTIIFVWRQGTELHSIVDNVYGLGLGNKINKMLYNTRSYLRYVDGGLIISETSTPVPRTIAVTQSVVYAASTPVIVNPFNSSTDRLTQVNHIGGDWVYTDVSVYDNQYYDTGTSTGLMDDNRWSNRFFYRSIGDVKQVFYTLGTDQCYNHDRCLLELPPTPPVLLRDHCLYIGQAIIEKNSSTGTIHPAFDHIESEPEFTFYESAGIWESPSITASTGIVTVGDGDYILYSDTEYTSNTLDKYTISGQTFVIPDDGAQHYIVAKYNNGTPIIEQISDVSEITQSNVIPVVTVYNLSGQILYIFWDQFSKGLSNKLCHRLVKTQRFQIQPGGLLLGEKATRYVTITLGNVWYGATYSALSAIDSSVAGNEIAMWYHVGGVLTRFTATQYDNTYYDNGTNRVELNPNRYAVNWVYRGVSQLNNRPVILLGGGNYTFAEAVASTAPTDVPAVTANFGVLVGRIIVLKGASVAAQIDTIATTNLTQAPITSHNALNDLQGGDATSSQFYHLTSAQHTIATQSATTGRDGYLTSADFTTFNNKAEKTFAVAMAIALG